LGEPDARWHGQQCGCRREPPRDLGHARRRHPCFFAGTYPNTGGDYNLIRGYLDTGDATTNTLTVSGIKFPLYDVIIYSDGDNGSATRVARFTLSGSQITPIAKYVRDDPGVDFSGVYTEADTTSPSGASGNYCRFRHARGSSITLTWTGLSGSDGHPRVPSMPSRSSPSMWYPC